MKMFKICNPEKYTFDGKECENNLVNMNLVSECYKSTRVYNYVIVFVINSSDDVIWYFDKKEDRDKQYYDLVGY